jgi:hypothetical protein
MPLAHAFAALIATTTAALYRAVTAGSGSQISDKNQVGQVPDLPSTNFQWGTCPPSELPRA